LENRLKEERVTSPLSTPVFANEFPESTRRRILEPVLIGVLALTLNLAGNGRISLWNRDEPRYACCVREMRARGDWICPTFNHEPRYQKPVLIYWLMRAGFAIGGDNPFGARLVSAVAGVGTCLLTWRLGRRALGPRAGLAAALITATAPIIVGGSKLATTDATLAFLVVGCQLCLWELSRRPSRRAAAGFWVLLALAILTKGPVAPAILAASALASWWWGGPTSYLRRLHWRWGLLGCALLTAPWYVAIGVISRGEFYRVAVGDQLVRRLTYGVEKHGGLPGYYLVSTLLTFYPWSSLIPAAVLGAWTRRRSHPALGFLLGWMVGPLLFFECIPTKLVHYYLPAIPASALLTGWLFMALAGDGVNLRRWPLGRLSYGLLAGIAVAVVVGLIAGVIILPWSMRWPCLVLAVVLTVGTLLALDRLQKGANERAVLGLVATWALMLFVACAWLLPAAEPYRTAQVAGERLATLSAEHHARPALLGFQEPSIVYALRQPVSLIRSWPDLYEQLGRYGRVITVALPRELKKLQSDPGLELEISGSLEGFNLNTGRMERLEFVVIRERSSAPLARSEETLVE
jgi:4-amino-4-deoxy-L-arabinose transferase-like glycosyltransferase